MTQHFYSNGKLLLSGEYAVLDGALALGLPTKQGQSLVVTPIDQPIVNWQAIDSEGEIWFETKFKLPLDENDHGSTIRTYLHNLLKAAQHLNPNFLTGGHGYIAKTTLDFTRDWGLGSSSTLINNIAQWANIDAHQLLWSMSKGSGYDIACAQHDTPITYCIIDQNPTITPVDFYPQFTDQLFFIHLNKKQDSAEEIINYHTKKIPDNFIDNISALTQSILECPNINDFKNLITEHENIIGNFLKIIPIKRRIFSDYFGAIKSLGAWGGDFILATGNNQTPSYFQSLGYDTIVSYQEMIK